MPSIKLSLTNAALVAVGLSAPACTFAVPNNPSFNGYYGGVMVGELRTESKISNQATSTFESGSDFIFDITESVLGYSQSDVKVHNYKGIGEIYLGFGHFIGNSNFYLAGEIFGNWANRHNDLNNWVFSTAEETTRSQSIAATTSIKLRHNEYGIDVRPGYLMDTNTLLYGRFGLAFNKMSNETSNTFSFADQDFGVQSSSTLFQANKKSVTGVRLGVGLERKVTDTLAITADYIYTYYGKVSTTGVRNTTTFGEDEGGEIVAITNLDGLQASSSARISTQAAMLGIKYYFYPVC